jgi:hypothetical protein
MEPIEQELEDRKVRLRKMAIELQRLQEKPKFPGGAEHTRKIVGLQYRIGQARSAIRELEEIIAEGRSPRRSIRPPKPKGRRLSPEEREKIVRAARAELLAKFRESDPDFDERNLQVTCGWTTDNDGNPQISFAVRGRA